MSSVYYDHVCLPKSHFLPACVCACQGDRERAIGCSSTPYWDGRCHYQYPWMSSSAVAYLSLLYTNTHPHSFTNPKSIFIFTPSPHILLLFNGQLLKPLKWKTSLIIPLSHTRPLLLPSSSHYNSSSLINSPTVLQDSAIYPTKLTMEMLPVSHACNPLVYVITPTSAWHRSNCFSVSVNLGAEVL